MEINMGLEVINVSYIVNNLSIVKSVHFSVRLGTIHALVGPNGAGKSTLFSLVGGEIFPNVGSIYWNGTDVTKLPLWKRVKMGFGYLPQQSLGFESLTVFENLSMIQSDHLQSVTNDIGLQSLMDCKLGLLSGGERRKVDIARLLLLESKLWILDEPFSSLDAQTIHWMTAVIQTAVNNGVTILLTDHALAQVFQLSDHISIIEKGTIILSGKPDDLKNDEIFNTRYSLYL